MECPSCSTENSSAHKFCGQCGSPLSLACGSCGFANDAKSRFCVSCGSSLQSTASATESAEPKSSAQAAERRHLTVMFCDLVGSTDLSVRIDPEDLSDVIRLYQQTCEQVIQRYGGFVARYMGDGLLTYFGYPTATEYDPERAVRAGLEVITAVHNLQPGHGLTLQTRIGIASGEVVVGEVVGDGPSREETVVGETPNLAARLQGISEPDTVVISGRTQRLIGGLFEYSDLGYHELKGFDKPIHAYAVTRESVVESRFEATRIGQSGSLIGREQELHVLHDSWQKAWAHNGQLVMISGEAGIGKSCLLENFRASLAPESPRVIRMYGSPHATGSVLYPVIAHCKRSIGIKASDPPGAQLDKLERHLENLGSENPLDLALMASLLSVPNDGRCQPLQLSPPEQKFQTLKMLVEQITRQCQQLPIVLIMEDLHWLDASTIEFLDLLIYEATKLPVLVIVTYRTEFNAPWQGTSHSSTLIINRLQSDSVLLIINQVTGGKSLPEKIIADILDKTDGVPLFVEELTKSIIASPLLKEEEDRYTLTGNISLHAIPSTLQDSLMARLDRLAPVKEVAQIGAAVGRKFSLELIRVVVDKPADVVDQALEQLVEAELIIKRGSAPHLTYIFKHALVQEAAYESMLHSTRRQLHGRIAEILRRDFSTQMQDRPDLLAHHYTAAEMHDQGFRYWFLASQHALGHFAHKEVAAHLNRGLEIADKLSDDGELHAMEFEMRSMLGSALMVLKGPGHEDVGRAYQSAYDFSLSRQYLEGIFPVRFGLCRYHWAAGRLKEAVRQAELLLPLVDIERDPGEYMAVQVLLGISLWHRGDSKRALSCLQRVSSCYRPERDASLFFTYMMDFGVFGSFYEALALTSVGRTEEAAEAAFGALSLARQLNNPHAIGFGLLANFITTLVSERFADSIIYANECIPFARAQGFPEFVAIAQVCKGSALVKTGQQENGLQLMIEGVTAWERTGFSAWRPWLRGLLAEGYLLLGQEQNARVELATAQVLMEQQDEHQAELYLLKIERQLEPHSHSV